MNVRRAITYCEDFVFRSGAPLKGSEGNTAATVRAFRTE